MKEISRIEFEKAVKIIENYVLQQEVNFKKSKNLLDKINCFYIKLFIFYIFAYYDFLC